MTTKIERTRENLRATAVRLFAQFGYEATSVALIASTAVVSEMTFFRHFPSQESVLIDYPFYPEIGEAIARQPDMLPPFVRAVRGIRAGWSRLPDGAEEDLRTRLRIVASTPALHSALGKNSTATEAVIAEALSSGLISDRTSRWSPDH
jgi:AcrR family transcriptional regulator